MNEKWRKALDEAEPRGSDWGLGDRDKWLNEDPAPTCPNCGMIKSAPRQVPSRFRTHGPFCGDSFHWSEDD